MKKETNFPMNLQFFADDAGNTGADVGAAGADGANTQTTGVEGASGDESNDTGSEAGKTGATGKTFTQEEMTATATNEKKQGKNSILKIFGCKTEEEAKRFAAEFKAFQDVQKTAEQKKADAEALAGETEKRAQMAENKLACVLAGVSKDSVDDALAIAVLRVTDEKDLDAVLKEMKTQAKYKGFFDDSVGSKGTGNPAEHHGSEGSKDNIGKRLAERNASTQTKKSSYFSN